MKVITLAIKTCGQCVYTYSIVPNLNTTPGFMWCCALLTVTCSTGGYPSEKHTRTTPDTA
jgi:hypothetical protein